jgi:hypothetical protein
VQPAKQVCNLDWNENHKRFSGAVCIPAICDANQFVPRLMTEIFKDSNYVMADDYVQENFCQIKRNFELDFDSFIAL